MSARASQRRPRARRPRCTAAITGVDRDCIRAMCAGIAERVGTDLGHQGTGRADRLVSAWVADPGSSTAGESRNGAAAGLALGALHFAGGDQPAVGARLGARRARQATPRLRLFARHLNDQPALLALVLVDRHYPCRAACEYCAIRALGRIEPPISHHGWVEPGTRRRPDVLAPRQQERRCQ